MFVSFAQFIINTDFQMLIIVLPKIGLQFDLPAPALTGLITVDAIFYASLIMTGGRLADIWGQKRCCILGLCLFGVGGLLLMLSIGLPMLLVARAFQGAGAALISPSIFSLMTAIPVSSERRRAYRMFGSVQGASLIVGPLFGGTLTSAFGWRSAYVLETAVVTGLLVAIGRIVPSKASSVISRQFDMLGAVLVGAAIVLFVAAVAGIGGSQLDARNRWISAMLAALCLLLLIVVESKSRSPLIPPAVLGVPRVITALLGMSFALAGSMAFYLLPNLLMQQILHWPAAEAGLGVLPNAFAVICASQGIAYLHRKLSPEINIGLGFLLMLVALILYSLLLHPTTYTRSILFPMLIGGCGGIISIMAMMADAASAVGENDQGVTAALGFTAQQLGIAIGSAVILSRASGLGVDRLIGSIQHAFLISAIFVMVGAACAVGLRHLVSSMR